MKKSYNPISDVRNESVDLTKRLYRNIFDAVHNLDDIRGRASSVSDLFTHQAETQRVRLRDCCERLMFSDTSIHGRKAEELLWRKGYYEVIYTAKRLRKGGNPTSGWAPDEMALVHHHVTAGIGQYHHLLSRLQFDCGLDLKSVVDNLVTFPDEGLKKGKNNSNIVANGIDKNGATNGEGGNGSGANEWAKHVTHRCMIYLGDLCRYLIDLQPGWDFGLPAHYYIQALMWKPEAGMPHNQLGTLMAGQNYSLDAVYHYMRCLCCPQTFEGTEGNLNTTLEKSARLLEGSSGRGGPGGPGGGETPNALNRMISRLLYLTRNWFCNKPVHLPLHRVCDDLLTDLKECLMGAGETDVVEEPDDIETFAQTRSPIDHRPTRLTEDMLFKMVAVVLMCLHSLEKRGNEEVMRAVALQLALISQILQQALLKIESVIPPPSTPPLPAKNGVLRRKRRRRRRRRRASSEGSSDLSEGDDVVYVSSTDTDISEEELVFDEHNSDTDDELPNGKAMNGINCGGEGDGVDMNNTDGGVGGSGGLEMPGDRVPNYRDYTTFQHLHYLSQQGFLLPTIKICFDWLGSNIEIIRSCSQACKPLITRAAAFLNHLIQVPYPFSKEEENSSVRLVISNELGRLPLPEDLCLRNLPALVSAQEDLVWNSCFLQKVSSEEEMYLRVYRMLTIGFRLAEVEAIGLFYCKDRKWFTTLDMTNNKPPANSEPARINVPEKRNGKRPNSARVNSNSVINYQEKQENVLNTSSMKHDKLMQDMGQLWLRAEVRELETKMKRTAQHLPPYLVLDCDALTLHCPLVKQLVSARKFIVLIPSIVVSALDEQKSVSGRVRDTIRWLEGQFRHGNRFIRAQRANERLSLPLIKYPKKKDKEAWLFFQVVECCHFLSSQGGGKDAGLVTLLTGSPTLLTSANTTGFSPLGIVKSAGISIEHIESFYTKWKSSCKSHG